jgi:hypothetical protein
MSKRAIRKLRHREDVKPMPSFKERMLAGQRGESLCTNPYCRKFAKEVFPNGIGCEHCYEIPEEHIKLINERIAQVERGEMEVLSSEEVHKNLRELAEKRHQEHEHVHGPDCNHDH